MCNKLNLDQPLRRKGNQVRMTRFPNVSRTNSASSFTSSGCGVGFSSFHRSPVNVRGLFHEEWGAFTHG